MQAPAHHCHKPLLWPHLTQHTGDWSVSSLWARSSSALSKPRGGEEERETAGWRETDMTCRCGGGVELMLLCGQDRGSAWFWGRQALGHLSPLRTIRMLGEGLPELLQEMRVSGTLWVAHSYPFWEVTESLRFRVARFSKQKYRCCIKLEFQKSNQQYFRIGMFPNMTWVFYILPTTCQRMT